MATAMRCAGGALVCASFTRVSLLRGRGPWSHGGKLFVEARLHDGVVLPFIFQAHATRAHEQRGSTRDSQLFSQCLVRGHELGVAIAAEAFLECFRIETEIAREFTKLP